jgi:phage repressor protein C with HTH and peptisase S24 domain
MDPRFMKVVIKGDSMWPTFSDGDVISCSEFKDSEIDLSAVVIFNHPLKNGVVCVKRVKLIDGDKIFVQGDNPDPTASEDSHNFGWISKQLVFALMNE